MPSAPRKKFLLITYYWPPAGGAGVQRWLYFSKHLLGLGWEAVVLSVNPKDATYPITDESLLAEVPDGIETIRTRSLEPLQWYGKLAGRERIPYGGFSNEKSNSWASKFIRGNFFIPDARRGWNSYALAAARKRLRQNDIQLIISTGPPHSSHLIGLELQAKTGIPWIADLRDPWSDVYYNFDMPRTGPARRYDRLLERKVLGSADVVTTASPGFAERFSRKVKRPYEVITNGYEHLMVPIQKPEGSPTYITYAGTMAESYQPQALLTALADLPLDFRLRVAGSLSTEVRQSITAAGLDARLDDLGYLPHSALEEELRKADLLLLLSPAHPGSEDIIPGKLFEYMATGVPILAVSPKGSAIESVVRKVGAGQNFAHSDERGMKAFLAEALTGKIAAPDAQKRSAYQRATLAKRMAEVMEQCVKKVQKKP